jgi:hypothetical protein
MISFWADETERQANAILPFHVIAETLVPKTICIDRNAWWEL